ncbi:MAG TPA: hemerythrin domain-containing protein [Gaiellaceae bacterium]|nr:hemerythrin domain-containing protein [Gaiellaceae bacterium]
MKRHPALVPLSHDHHHTLVRARELREAAAGGEEERRTAAERFRAHFAFHVVRHFREEEELVFPLLPLQPSELDLVLAQHQRIRALARALREPSADTCAELGSLLEEHVRLEERVVFELVQEHVPEAELAALRLTPREERPDARGPVWGAASDDLNATILVWPPGEGPAEHVNEHRDVLYVALAGSAELTVDGEPRPLREGDALVVEKGSRRALAAGPDGVRYLTAHLRRGGLELKRF